MKCCLCGKIIKDYGNNAWPLKKNGKCCDVCNIEKVIPERLKNKERR